jgi:hypothetical protein
MYDRCGEVFEGEEQAMTMYSITYIHIYIHEYTGHFKTQDAHTLQLGL